MALKRKTMHVARQIKRTEVVPLSEVRRRLLLRIGNRPSTPDVPVTKPIQATHG